ncbi:MAG TPA: response regulator, partial [Candidatus Saccharimonadales bacterium]|nr:response regulator [Candidatus Saccharimonadales bacterium]
LIMPRIDGARLCAFLKSHPDYASIPVVILSGILADEIEGIETIRADAYVAKMPMEKLQATLLKVFQLLEEGGRSPVVEGFDGMYRREVVVEFLEERRVRELVLNSLAEGIVDLNEDGRILRTNRAFERMTGKSAEQLLSRPIAGLFPGSDEMLGVMFRDARKAHGEPAIARVQSQDRTFRFRLHTMAMEAADVEKLSGLKRRAAEENERVRLRLEPQLPGYVLLVQEITEEVRAQEERDRFRERMARSERMSAFGMFVAGAAHELNNPLTGVLGYSQLLAARARDPEMKASLLKIEEGANRCRRIVDNLMVFSRRGEKDRRPEEAEAVLDDVIRECAPRAAACGVDLRPDVSGPVGSVRVCRTEVVQALVAVVDNGILAAAAGKPPRRVVVSLQADPGTVNFEVIDSGAGIPESILSRVFDPFFTTRDVGEGRGLGLSVAFGVARAHGGTVSAMNSPGGGACLSFRLPLETVPATPEDGPSGRGRREGRILVVDDEPVVQDLLADFLGNEFEVHKAFDGRQGLALAESTAFDVIFLDIRMPDMSGREMYEALRSIRPAMADRVVFTTGDVVQEQTREFLDSVSQPCLPKPFSLSAVTEIVERFLGASRTI